MSVVWHDCVTGVQITLLMSADKLQIASFSEITEFQMRPSARKTKLLDSFSGLLFDFFTYEE